MPINSSPKAGASTPDGEDYNALRNDVLYNHDHSGGINGATVDHANLSGIGTQTHDQLEASINTINSKVTFSGFQKGTWVPTAGGNYTWGGNWLRVEITFPVAFSSVPIVTATMNMIDPLDVDRVFSPMITSKTTTGFVFLVYSGEIDYNDPILRSPPMGGNFGFDWIAIA